MQSGSLRLQALTKRYGNATVVTDVSVTIAPGQFLSLLGPSGSGKTTTLMMVAGFTQPDEGQILVDGRDITRLAPQHRHLGMVFQNYALFPHMSVSENIAFPLRVRGMKDGDVRQRVDWALDVVRLAGFGGRLPRELSGGQQQRVALARAIVFQPPVILMDEPLGALDKNLRYQMQVEIKDIQQRLGMTVIYVTHDQEEALNMSDVIAIMNNGRIEQIGEPVAVYNRPESIFASRFLGEANLIDGAVEAGDVLAVSGHRLRAERVVRDPAMTRGGRHFVRPERISLRSEADPSPPDDGVNIVRGTVARTAFLGNLIRYGIDIAAGESLTVDARNDGSRAVLDVGQPVEAFWHPSDAVLYRND